MACKRCSVCRKKVKPSELKEIETVEGAKITCCTDCAKFFKVGQKDK